MRTFQTWAELLDHVSAGHKLYYHAPMDYRPVFVTAKTRRDGKVRVYPIYSNADSFTADIAHLDRFRQEDK
jgi:hypothetical protein